MTINTFSLYVANRVQEAHQIKIDLLANKTNRSSATIRRAIHTLNDYLPLNKQFIVTESTIINQLSYTEFVHFIQELTISDFSTTGEERLQFLLCLSMTNDFTNFSKLYELLEISQSTKKKDRPIFSQLLQQAGLTLHSFRGKGVSIIGDELTLRIKAALILSKIIEIDEENKIVPRQANNPCEQLLYSLINNLFDSIAKESSLHQFINKHALTLNYTSMKFLYVYYSLSLRRQQLTHFINHRNNVPVKIHKYRLFHHEQEDFALSMILASLDNHGKIMYPNDSLVITCRTQLFSYVEDRIYTTFYSKEQLTRNLDQYLYKCIMRHFLNYDFYDNKLDDVKKEFSFLYQLVEYCYQRYLSKKITLDEHQLSTLTLIFREHVLKNKIAGRNLKKIVIITNSAKEKSNFFSQQLLYYFDTQVIAILNINELYQLKYLKFDNLMTFSNRISTILNENGFPNIKVNYYFHPTDIDYLTKLNFSNNSHRKLIAADFVSEIQQCPSESLSHYLKDTYPNFFV